MKRYIAIAIVLTTVFSGCQLFNGGAPKGYKHINIENGTAEFNVPDNFSIRKDTVVHATAPVAYDMKVYKFLNKNDTSQLIVFNYSVNYQAKMTLDNIMSNVAMQSRNPMFKLKGNDTLRIAGQKFLSFGYTRMLGATESDYSHILLTILNDQIYQLAMVFKGPVKPEYSTIADNVTKSFKLKK